MTNGLVVNTRCLFQLVSGVERYTAEVTARLGERLRPLRPAGAGRGVHGHLWEQIRLPRLLRAGELLWSPANTGPIGFTRQVVTIHDISPIDHPEWFRPSFASWYGYLFPRLVRTARRIITDSQFSRQRIIEAFDAAPSQVVAIPLGVDARFCPEQAQYKVNGHGATPYFLAVGSLQPRKNLRTLFRAWRRSRLAQGDVRLLVVGTSGAAFRPESFQGVPPGVELLGAVADAALPGLYARATGFIMPSLYEGFGLPVLEAMASGVPVICSNRTALPETAGAAALLVDPTDEDGLADALRRVWLDADLRGRLRASGLAHAARFTWERTASQTWSVLEAAADD